MPAKEQLKEKTQTKTLRPPVVAVLGHVDHGKTSLLDKIRKTKVAEKEFGGITQHIGAYQIEFKGRKITFIDTPGHEAFSKMRSRGAQATDIALLVVAADDGVMPQTKESIAHIKAAKVPLIVAINKIDLASADVQKVKQQLAQNEVMVEEYGGDVVSVPLSAKTGEGIDELLEMINLVADMQELKADLETEAEGVIIESRLDRFKGPVASVLVKKGILRVGDHLVVGEIGGKVKLMINDSGQPIKEALPSTPVEILGLEKVPRVGDVFRKTQLLPTKAEKLSPEKRKFEFKVEEKQFRLILKTDAEGSLESIVAAIEKIPTDLEIKFILKETGDINESDVLLASSAKAILVGFNVKVSPNASRLAQEEKVLVRVYNIIYELLDELKEVIEGKVEINKEEIIGKAKIIALFGGGEGRIAGCRILEGAVSVGDKVRIIRGENEIGKAKVKSLRKVKEFINRVKASEECGMMLDPGIDFSVGDIIESYRI